MTLCLSRPFEELRHESNGRARYHTIIVGSGYGAAMAALALASKEDKNFNNDKILVIERGREFTPGDFPKTLADLPGDVSVQGNKSARTGYADALFDVRAGENVTSIIGSGLGGTSLINAGVAVDPDENVLSLLPARQDGRSWASVLAPSLTYIRTLLGVGPHPRGDRLAKVKALKTLSTALQKAGQKASHHLADIAVNFTDGANVVGVDQRACNDCGNCFTGCNIGAKNTLAMNAWPLARQLGVDIVTGGTVDYVSHQLTSNLWQVFVTGTTDRTTTLTIEAERVILAAGAFGSTEILARSHQNGLAISAKMLGAKFSLNGDGISFGFGQKLAVRSAAKVPSDCTLTPGADQAVGPTIVSMIAVNGQQRGLIEDASVPQAMSRLWGEVMSTQALVRGYVEDKQSAWHQDHSQADPLAVSDDLIDHHQAVLQMGLDPACGQMTFADDRLQISWPAPAPGQSFDPNQADAWFNTILKAAENLNGLDGGLLLSNPAWRPFPTEFDAVFEGASKFGGGHLCNHPLGGCPMGSDASNGVVNTQGQVFAADGQALSSLYVLDGAIIPGALGINPFMTIAALAHRLAHEMDQDVNKDAGASFPPPAALNPVAIPIRRGRVVAWPPGAERFSFTERLFGPNAGAPSAELRAILGLPDEAPPNCLVIDAEIHFANIYAWLENPDLNLPADFTLYYNPQGDRVVDSVAQTAPLTRLAGPVRGFVQLFARDRNGPGKSIRALRAIWRFLQLPGDEFAGFGGNSSNSLIDRILGYWRVANRHGEWRCLNYQFDADVQGHKVHIQGTKHLAYDGLKSRVVSDDANPWISLVNIDLTFTSRDTGRATTARLHVDLLRMSKFLDPLQSLNPAETPQALLGAAGLMGLAIRVMTQTHLWSFGAPNYRRFQGFDAWLKERMFVPNAITYGPPGQQRRFSVTIARPTENGWRLMKASAAPAITPRPPVLMIHGMAHGSRVFYTETVDHSMAGHLLDAGHDVWLLDHGLSICLGAPTATDIETIADQIAAAVKFVYTECNQNRPGPQQGILVFSHCVGSAAFSMAVLGGQTDAEPGQSMIGGLAMHAIPPWIYPSEGNHLRSNIGMGLRRLISDDALNPIPYDDRAEFTGKAGPKQPAAQLLIDRFGSSLPWRAPEYTLHAGRDDDDQFGRTICNRMTVLYGYEWQHANLDPRTHRNLMTLVGPALGDAYAELRLMLHRGQITTKRGENEFVVADNFETHWTFPTLFIHGDHNNVFDVESSRLSARKLTEINQSIAVKGGNAQTVDLRIIPGYGHMDLLFGMQAYQVVYPHISSFFAGQHNNRRDAEPKTRPEGEYQVITGPIISRPRRNEAGGLTIRLWVEADEYQVETISTIQFLTGPDLADPISESDIKWIRQGLQTGPWGHSNSLYRSSFWIADIDCTHIRGGLRSVPLLIDMPSMNDIPVEPARVMEWTALPWYRRLAANLNSDRLSFILGSCWYPGMWIDQHISDRIFTKIRSHIESPTGIDMLLLAGDQIYADATRAIFDISEDRERFQESYRRAFNMPQAAWVLRHVPTYLAIDDHELRDNYPSPLPSDGPTTLSDLCASGVAEAWNFQIHHELTPNPCTHHLWYAFEQSGFDFFVFDTRTERNYAAKGLDRLIGPEQVRAFESWAINRRTDRPYFVVTGTPLTPIPRDHIAHPADAALDDSLRAFPEFFEMAAGIMRKTGRTQKFILLSGDPHFSSVTEFDVCEKPGLEPVPFIGIVSSGINVPLPFANDYPDRTNWGKSNDIFKPVGHELTVLVKEATILSSSHAHAVRCDVSRNEQGRWTIVLSVVDADDSGLPFAKVIDL